MKKKVLLYGLVSLLAVAAGIFGMVSCNKDNSSSASNNVVVGTWEGREYTLIFNADNTGVAIEKGSSYYSKGERHMFTYTMTDANSGVIKPQGDDYYDYYEYEEEMTITFKIAGNTMTLYGSYSYDYYGYNYGYDFVMDILTRQGGNPSDDGNTANVVGTWYGERGSSHTLTITFNANGTGNYVDYFHDPYSGDERETGTFTYSMTDSQNGYIYVYDYYYGTESIRFRIEGNTMYLYDDYDYYYGYDEIEWVLTKQR